MHATFNNIQYLLNICFKVLNKISVCVGEKYSRNIFKVLNINVNIVSLSSLIINYVLKKMIEEKTRNSNLSLKVKTNQ